MMPDRSSSRGYIPLRQEPTAARPADGLKLFSSSPALDESVPEKCAFPLLRVQPEDAESPGVGGVIRRLLLSAHF